MGLFDFVKNIVSSDSSTAKKVKEAIENNNPGVRNLGVTFDGGIASITGHCKSGEAHQQVAKIARSVEGVIDVDLRDLSYDKTKPAEKSAATVIAAGGPAKVAAGGGDAGKSGAEPKTEEYVIKSGDTLGKLAKQYYGDAMKYPKIFEANRDVIEDPNKIYVGQKIRIPLD